MQILVVSLPSYHLHVACDNCFLLTGYPYNFRGISAENTCVLSNLVTKYTFCYFCLISAVASTVVKWSSSQYPTFGTVRKSLEKGLKGQEIRGKIETIQTIVLLRSARIPEETCCNSDSSERPSNACVKNLPGIMLIITSCTRRNSTFYKNPFLLF